MEQILNCTGCGATLEYSDGPEHTMRCQYCGIYLPLPDEFWREAEDKTNDKQMGGVIETINLKGPAIHGEPFLFLRFYLSSRQNEDRYGGMT
jgi:hypothetical protein